MRWLRSGLQVQKLCVNPEQPCAQWSLGALGLTDQMQAPGPQTELYSHEAAATHILWATNSHRDQITNLYSFRGTLRPQTLLLPASQGGPRWRNAYVAEPNLLVQDPSQGSISTQIHLSLHCQGKGNT